MASQFGRALLGFRRNCRFDLSRSLLVWLLTTASGVPVALAADNQDGDGSSDKSQFPQGASYTSESLAVQDWDNVQKSLEGTPYRVLCFQLLATGVTEQPFVLSRGDNGIAHCSPGDEPLTNGSNLVIAINTNPSSQCPWAPKDLELGLRVITLNIALKQGTPIDPSPIRGAGTKSLSVPADNAFPRTIPRVIYLRWPDKLPGDVIPTITIQGVFTKTLVSTVAEHGLDRSGNELTGACDKQYNFDLEKPRSGGTAGQTFTLLNITLPQVHTLYHFSAAIGFVVNSVFLPSFGNSIAGPIQTGTSPNYDGVVFISYYFDGIDAESNKIFNYAPGVAFGISLIAPTSNFYLGLSWEFVRNIELVGGVCTAKVSALAPAGTVPPSVSAPATVSQLKVGGYIGLSFNFVSFFKGLIGKGG